MNQSTLTVDELLVDESFISWVLNPTADLNAKWQAYLSVHKDQLQVVNEAAEFLRQFSKPNTGVAASVEANNWNAIQSTITTSSKKKSNNAYRTALLLGLFILGGMLLFALLTRNNNQNYATNFGERKTIELPDGSIAILNANSSLQWDKDFQIDKKRKIYLEGEAFFDIRKSKKGTSFWVISDHLNVQVTGTKFAVNQRNYGTRVTLEEGSINLQPTNSKNEIIEMKPGESGFYDVKTANFDKGIDDTKLYTSWKDNVLYFNNTDIDQIVSVLYENYGYIVRIDDEKIWQENISGTLPAGNIDVLVEALEVALQIDIVKEEKVKKLTFK